MNLSSAKMLQVSKSRTAPTTFSTTTFSTTLFTRPKTSMVVLLLMCLTASCTSGALSNEQGFYISNMTSIVFINNSQQDIVYQNPKGMISALALDVVGEALMFWSDVSVKYSGIYYANLPNLRIDHKIDLNPRAIKVLGLAVDPLHNNLYWTDESQSTVEIYSYISMTRRTLVFVDISAPRGIALDLTNGFLYWNDQKLNRIERSRLDGSDRKVILRNTKYPNHMVVHEGRLYWLSSDTKQLLSTDASGSDTRTVADFKELVGEEHIFGLTIDREKGVFIVSTACPESVLFSVFMNNFKINEIKEDFLGSNLYGLASPTSLHIPNPATNACKVTQGMSLALGQLTQGICTTIDSKAVILCPSYGGLVQDGDSCIALPPLSSVLLFTILDYGYIAYVKEPIDLSKEVLLHKDVQFVYKKQRPAALAFDRISKMVYWSHVKPYAIYRCGLKCTSPTLLLAQRDGIGAVEGMFYNPFNRLLVFTDYGEGVKENGEVYGWNRIHLFDADNYLEKKIWTVLEAGRDAKLRSVYMDNMKVVYTDWGGSGKIGEVTLISKSHNTIKSGLDNPNGLFVDNNVIYFIDSHYKHNVDNDAVKNAELVSISRRTVVNTFDIGQRIPFGISLNSVKDKLYISDWQHNQVLSFNYSSVQTHVATNVRESKRLDANVVIRNIPSVFNLLSTDPSSTTALAKCLGCEGICVEDVCYCPSHSVLPPSSKCQHPPFFILLSDMTSLKLVGLSNTSYTQNLVTTLATGDAHNTDIKALVYNETTGTVYYFDRQRLMQVELLSKNKKSSLVYQVNHNVESMVLIGDDMIWIDELKGIMCFLRILPKPASNKHKVLLTGLSNPRSIRYHKGFIYWSERGFESVVAQLNVSAINSNEQATKSVLLQRSEKGSDFQYEHIYIDPVSERLLVKDSNGIHDCSLDGSNCKYMKVKLGEVGDFYSTPNFIVFTDLADKSLKAVYLKDASLKPRVLVSNLVRPGKLYVKSDTSKSTVCSGCVYGKCIPMIKPLNYCHCTSGYIYNPQRQECMDTISFSKCLYNRKEYNFSSIVHPTPYTTCTCEGNGNSDFDSDTMKGFTCSRTKCPVLSCPAEVRIVDGPCCGSCRPTRVQFTNCPNVMVEVPLPPFANYIIEKFRPMLKECHERRTLLEVIRTPLNNIIQWKDGTGVEEQLSDVTFKPYHSGDLPQPPQCSYKVKLKDVTKPLLICPHDVRVYTLGEKAEGVIWPPAEAYDNVGVMELYSKPALNSTFPLGHTKVLYYAKDYSGLTSLCAFNVNIFPIPFIDRTAKEESKSYSFEKRDDTTMTALHQSFKNCLIQNLINGYYNCSIFKEDISATSYLSCDVVCNSDTNHMINPDYSSSYVCFNGVWSPELPVHIRSFQCRANIKKTLTGVLPLELPDKCQSKNDMDFDYTRLHLQYALNDKITSSVYTALTYQVGTDGCAGGGGDKKRRKRSTPDLIYNIEIPYKTSINERPALEDKMTELMNNSKMDIDRNYINLITKSESQGYQNQFYFSFQEIFFKYGCKEGLLSIDSETCFACPVGFFPTSLNCSICPENTYNSFEGAFSCLSCPQETSSPSGSVSQLQCYNVETEPTGCNSKCKVGLAVGIPVVLIFLILLVLLVFFFLRCKGRSGMKKIFVTNNNGVYQDPTTMNAVKWEADVEEENRLYFLNGQNGVYVEPENTENSQRVKSMYPIT